MAALTKERPETHERDGLERVVPVAANTVIYAGAGVVLDNGYAAPASEDTGLVTLGRAEETVDNTGGAAGAKSVRVRRGCFRFGNSADSDEITTADIGSDCYWVDDQTVAKTDGSGSRSVAGSIFDVDDDGVWVIVG